jgi:hypothetical protein
MTRMVDVDVGGLDLGKDVASRSGKVSFGSRRARVSTLTPDHHPVTTANSQHNVEERYEPPNGDPRKDVYTWIDHSAQRTSSVAHFPF